LAPRLLVPGGASAPWEPRSRRSPRALDQEFRMRILHSRRPRTTLSDAQRFRRDGVSGGMRTVDYLTDADRSRIVEEVVGQLLEVPRKHFPRTNNLEYAILKTHLIIEYALTQFIRCTSHVLVEVETLRFTFSEKLELAVLHGFGNGCPNSVPSIELLNRIRNQLAHRFSFDRQLVNELIRINTEDIDVARLTDRQRIACLRSYCYFSCGQMAGYLKAVVEMTKRA
jgi:hypothetical protein